MPTRGEIGGRQHQLDAIMARLREAETAVLTTHVTPDGDGLGAALALCRWLRRCGKEAWVINCSSAPHDLRWLYERGEFHVYSGGRQFKRVQDADVIVATDIGGSDRLGKMMEPVKRSKATKLVIDHHIYENDLFDLELIDCHASSSAEITYRLLQDLGADIDVAIAEPLYVGLVSDTGGFAYSATSPAAHEMAAELLEAGVDPHYVWRKLTCQVPFNKMRFLGLLMARLNLVAEERLVWTSVDLDFLKRNETAPRDAFEIVNHFLHLKGVEVGAFFMEISKTKTKVSMRSAGRIDVCEIAKGNGGGGHRFAAGCTIEKGLARAIPTVLDALERLIVEAEEEDAAAAAGAEEPAA
ncbi:MAG: hypothetical protein CMJ83_02050 [Planctomycetes bacterium]|nr:hypothetical protein [Planctomycetota bacterium]